MAQITYNGITLPYCYISNFAQRVVMDEVGGVDAYVTEFDIQAQCVVHYYYLSQLISDWNKNPPTNTNPAAIMYFIRQKLRTPRQRLSVQINGVELIPNYNTNKSFIDAQNGPFPKNVDIIQMTNTSFLISFSIVAKYYENIPNNTTANFATSNVNGSAVLYNRWGESVDVDDCNYSVKTRTGKFVIRTDNPDGFIADQLRTQFAAVSIPTGFLRDRSNYKVDPSGMGLEYTLVDKEVYKKPPSPAFKAQGYYQETATKFGAIRRGECHVKLWGAQNTDQSQLIQTAINLCSNKLAFRGLQLKAAGQVKPNIQNIIDNAMVRMDLFENNVECSISAWIAATNQRFGGVAAFIPFSTYTPFSDPQYTPPYTVYGTGNILLQAAAYYDPTIKNKLVPSNLAPISNPIVTVGNVQVQNQGTQIGQAGKLGGI